jgi:hypothetical protein
MTDNNDINIKLCYLNDKINRINNALDQQITDARSVTDINKQLVENQNADLQALKSTPTYSRTEVDLIFATKQEVQNSVIENQVSFSDIYTRTQSDSRFALETDLQNNYYPKTSLYTQSEVDSLFVADPSLYHTKATIDSNFDLQSTDLVLKKKMVPQTGSSIDLGTSAKPFQNLYMTNTSTINLGSTVIKKNSANDAIEVPGLVIGNSTTGKYKLTVAIDTSDNSKSLLITDMESVQTPINIHELSDMITQNAASIASLQFQLDNL